MLVDTSVRVAVLLPIAVLAACASDPPPPPERGHPALPETAAAAPARLEALKGYRDFLAQPVAPSGDKRDTQQMPTSEESQDAHEH